MIEPYRPADAYTDVFFSPDSMRVMRAGSILPPELSPEQLLSDLTTEIGRAEQSLGAAAADTERLLVEFSDYVRRGLCILGSPLLTNIAAKHPVLASCTAVPLDAAVLAAADFVVQLLGQVRRARVLLAVIGQSWLTAADAEGRRLIDDPEDWVRRELQAAAAAGTRVIPVLTDGARPPTAAQLPADIAWLSGHVRWGGV